MKKKREEDKKPTGKESSLDKFKSWLDKKGRLKEDSNTRKSKRKGK